MSDKIKDYLKTLRSATKSDKKIIIGIVLIFLLIIFMNVQLVSRIITRQTEEIGQVQLENIRSELQTMLTDAENTTMRVAFEAEQMMAANVNRYELAAYFGRQQKDQLAIFKGACMDVYIGGQDWAIIPGFDIPADYHPPERLWYKGAIENPGRVYITEPYRDARTGTMCYTMSTLLSDGQTVVALDFNFSNTQKSIHQMTLEGDRSALITTNDGKIISYDDMTLVGEKISKVLKEYEVIFNKVLSQPNHNSFIAELDDKEHTVFSSQTNNGWFMILCVDNWALYKNSYKQILISSLVSIAMLVMIVAFYLASVKHRIEAERALQVKEEFLSNLSQSLRAPLKKIINLSNTDSINKNENLTQIKESAMHLSGMIDNLLMFSNIVFTEKVESVKANHTLELSKTSRRVRWGIITALLLTMTCGLGVYINVVMDLGENKMLHDVETYEHQLSNWIAREKSILSMFSNMIAERPETMSNYDDAVKWLNDIAENYPEISVCYLANPYNEHTVIMNNGWEGPEGWHVEERPWYIDTEKADDGFNISAPYYDDQTGLYCVTLSQVVYGKNGEFLGIFAIDFFLDKLIDILGQSYTKDSYAFLVDKNGVIINHPSEDYQLSIDNTTPIITTKYNETYVDGTITQFNDYNGNFSICLATKNEDSDFTVMIVNRWWSIYGNVFVWATILVIVFGFCVAAVDMLIDRLIKWQDSVNHQLKQAADTAVAAGKAKSQFLAHMSHEIRTPINAVIGMNEMILRECNDPPIIKYAQNAHTASEALLSLINDILDFSKIESGKMELVEEIYHLDDLIKNLVNMIQSRAEKKNLELKLFVDENIPNELFGDSARIRQVVVNFLTNAVKYTQVGSVEFSVKYQSVDDKNIELIFSIKDTGIGIKDEDKKKLFKDFERFDSKINKNIEGTGLGLAITSKLVKMMTGEIQVESIYGEGSTFTVMIPQKVMGEGKVGNFDDKLNSMKKQETYKVSFIAPDARILVVDDNEMNLLVATSLLKATKIQVDTAISGMVALKKLAEKEYDLVFLDQMMPSLDGIQTLKLAKNMEENKSPDIPMIALTANAISGAKDMFIREGFTDYLTKPIDAREMEQMLMNYLPTDKLKAPPKDDDLQKNNSTQRINNPATNESSKDEPSKNESSKNESSNHTSNESQNNGNTLKNNGNTSKNNGNTSQDSSIEYKYLNVELGLQYSAGMEDMYKDILTMFCNLKDDKCAKIQEAFDNEDWKNYTTLVHALKSTSLSIGGEKCSEVAKQLEMAGKKIIAGSTTELEKHEGEEYIKEHHAEVMELYDKLVDEGRQYLNLGMTLEETQQNNDDVKSELQNTDDVKSDSQNNDDIKSNLQDAFDNEDWLMYSILIEEFSDVDKNIKMACMMITSDFTNEQEKQDAINYIKENHSKVMETL